MKKRILENIEPKVVFKYFEEISEIPRESENEKEISEYLIEFAESHKLNWYRDEKYNVIINKDAFEGYESAPTVILQGHTDMVCEKNQDTVHDFKKDPIQLMIDGDKITAKGTTLGADNGLGVAMMLAILSDNNIKHPKLEALFTTTEETGMLGAEALDKSKLKGEILINLDSNDEGYFVVGCAGGPAVLTEIPIKHTELPKNYESLKIEVRGLLGGHSGEDIHRGRANAVKLMVRTLMAIDREIDFFMADLDSGKQYNAIPREADSVIMINQEDIEKVNKIVARMKEIFQNEYRSTDKKITVNIKKENTNSGKPLTEESKEAVLNYLYLADSNIIRMDLEIEDTVESSLSIGVVKLEKNKVAIQTLTRSSVESMYMEMYNKILKLTEIIGGENSIISNCPEWEYNLDSKIKDIFEETYSKMYSKDAKSIVLHAGLEPGMLSKGQEKSFDMISLGPDIRNLHNPDEYLVISSTARFWDFLLEGLKNIK